MKKTKRKPVKHEKLYSPDLGIYLNGDPVDSNKGVLTGAVSGPRVTHSWHLAVDGKIVLVGHAYSERLAQLTMRAHAKRYAQQHGLRVGDLTWGKINTRVKS